MIATGTVSTKGHIEVTDLAISYRQANKMVNAVQDVTIDCQSGEFVSIVGPSGCGKSTLLNAIAGFIKPSNGKLILDGQEIRGPGADRGMVFQQYSLFPWLSVRRNVEFV